MFFSENFQKHSGCKTRLKFYAQKYPHTVWQFTTLEV